MRHVRQLRLVPHPQYPPQTYHHPPHLATVVKVPVGHLDEPVSSSCTRAWFAFHAGLVSEVVVECLTADG